MASSTAWLRLNTLTNCTTLLRNTFILSIQDPYWSLFISKFWINIQRLMAQNVRGITELLFFFSPTLNSKGRRRFRVYFFCRSTEDCNLLLQSQSPLGQYLPLLVPKTFSAHDPR